MGLIRRYASLQRKKKAMSHILADLWCLVSETTRLRWQSWGHFQSEYLSRFGMAMNLYTVTLVALWAEYCGVSLDDVDRFRTFELLRLLIGYTRKFDDIVDTPAGIRMFVSDRLTLKSHAKLMHLSAAMADWVCRSGLVQPQKAALVQAIQEFRRKAVFGAYHSALALHLDGKMDVTRLLPYVEQTSGSWAIVSVRLLNIMHQVPAKKATRAEILFFHWWVAAQYIDDAFDYPLDRQDKCLNLVSAILRDHPREESAVHELFARPQRLWGWLPVTAPETYVQLRGLFDERLRLLETTEPGNEVIGRIRNASEAAFRLAIVYRLRPFQRDRRELTKKF